MKEEKITTHLKSDDKTMASLIATDDKQNAASIPLYPSYRLLVALLGMCSMIASFSTQTSMSSALVCMTNNGESQLAGANISFNLMSPQNGSDGKYLNLLLLNGTTVHEKANDTWKLSWNSDERAFTLSIFFIGYFTMQLPSGLLPIWFGAKNALVLSIFIMTALQLLAVPAAWMGLTLFYAGRFLTGLVTAPVFACVWALAAKWAPRHEISTIVGLCGMGIEIGSALTFAMSSLACKSDYQGGWPIVFYTVGGWCLTIGILNSVFLSDDPSSNRFISLREKVYILKNTPKVRRPGSDNKIKVPLCKILRSRPVWAIIVAKFSANLIYYLVVTQMPIYLDEILSLPDAHVSLVSGIPILFAIPAIYAAAYISDRLVSSKICRMTTMRKINEGTGKLLHAGLVICLGFIPIGSTISAFLICTFIAFGHGAIHTGCISNVADLSPEHTSFIMGLVQLCSLWISFVIPLVYNAMTKDQKREQWRNVFYLTAGLQLLAFVFYAIFGSGEFQPWARLENTEDISVSNQFPRKDQGHNSAGQRQKPKSLINHDSPVQVYEAQCSFDHDNPDQR